MDVNYSEALEQQLAILRYLRSGGGAAAWFKYLTVILDELDNPIELSPERADRARLNAIWQLSHSETYFVASSICELLEGASRLYPLEIVQAQDLPSRNGFMLFQRPITWVHTRAWALSWSVDQDGIIWLMWPDDKAVERRLPLQGGLLWQDEINEDGFGLFANAITGSFAAFVSQRILTVEHARVERHARKRALADGWVNEPIVRVVELRRRQSAAASGDSPADQQDWRCRWMVGGHWRQQACGPKYGQRKTRWIAPYVKGPDDKPLKPPRATVFAVVR